jgi:hypothetical protein
MNDNSQRGDFLQALGQAGVLIFGFMEIAM